MNPTATFYLSGGGKIVVELLPDYAPNTVNSFIHCALSGALDNWPIQRIVPGSWIDLSYTAFKKAECKYLIPRESVLNPQLPLIDSVPGCVCMGGYGERGNAGCEPFFPLRPCPEHKGIYPVFGKVIEGMEELYRLEKVETKPVKMPFEGMEVNEPLTPQVILKVELDLKGKTYPRPVKVDTDWIPPTWKEDFRPLD